MSLGQVRVQRGRRTWEGAHLIGEEGEHIVVPLERLQPPLSPQLPLLPLQLQSSRLLTPT